jgi:hypothetical protein
MEMSQGTGGSRYAAMLIPEPSGNRYRLCLRVLLAAKTLHDAKRDPPQADAHQCQRTNAGTDLAPAPIGGGDPVDLADLVGREQDHGSRDRREDRASQQPDHR